MRVPDRKTVVKQAVSVTAGATTLAWGAPLLTAVEANDRLTLGVVGMSRGLPLPRAGRKEAVNRVWILVALALFALAAVAVAPFVGMEDIPVIAPTELPVGILTALMGGPFFLWLLLARSRRLETF